MAAALREFQVVIHYDAMIVSEAMQEKGKWHGQLAILVAGRGMMEWRDGRGIISWKHVKAHDWHPCNELADVDAKGAARCNRRGVSRNNVPSQPFTSSVIPACAWTVALDADHRKSLGYLDSIDGSVQFVWPKTDPTID